MGQTIEPEHSASVQDYIKAIYKLQQSDRTVSTNQLAHKVGMTPAAATKMIKHLADCRLAEYTPYYGVRLTERGERLALSVIRRHRLIELFLHKTLGYTWDEVDAEAERLEHHISSEFEARIDRALDYPRYDPHGDPIPTLDGVVEAPFATSLVDIQPGATVVVRRVGDSDPAALRYLAAIGIGLMSRVEVIERHPFNGPITLLVDGHPRTIGRELAARVYVAGEGERREERGEAGA